MKIKIKMNQSMRDWHMIHITKLQVPSFIKIASSVFYLETLTYLLLLLQLTGGAITTVSTLQLKYIKY